MKNHIITFVIALTVGYLGGISSKYFHDDSDSTSDAIKTTQNTNSQSNPFLISATDNSDQARLEQLQSRVSSLEQQLRQISNNTIDTTELSEDVEKPSASMLPTGTSVNQSSVPNRDDLLTAGVNSAVADDILYRLSQQEFRRLELQNLIRRNAASGAQQYRQELNDLNKNEISLRSELGDDTYDEYLFVNGQNNRVKVSSVMSGSPAELSGFKQDDVILSYGDKKILNWSDISSATLEGNIGNYTNVDILRDGERMSLMVPRGTLGVQLDPIQLDPTQ